MRMMRGGLLRGVATTAVIAGTATAVSGGMKNRQEAKQQAANPAPAAPATTTAPATPQDAMVAELTQLSTLKDQGIITQDEFDAKKKQLLGI